MSSLVPQGQHRPLTLFRQVQRRVVKPIPRQVLLLRAIAAGRLATNHVDSTISGAASTLMPAEAMDRLATAIPSPTKSSFSKVGYASGVPGKLPSMPPAGHSTFRLALSTHSSSLSVHDGSPFYPRGARKLFPDGCRAGRFRAISQESKRSQLNSTWRSPGHPYLSLGHRRPN